MKEKETLQTGNDIWTGFDTATEIQMDTTHRDIDTQGHRHTETQTHRDRQRERKAE